MPLRLERRTEYRITWAGAADWLLRPFCKSFALRVPHVQDRWRNIGKENVSAGMDETHSPNSEDFTGKSSDQTSHCCGLPIASTKSRINFAARAPSTTR